MGEEWITFDYTLWTEHWWNFQAKIYAIYVSLLECLWFCGSPFTEFQEAKIASALEQPQKGYLLEIQRGLHVKCLSTNKI